MTDNKDGEDASASPPAKTTVWVVFDPSRQTEALRRIAIGEEQIIGRDYPSMTESLLGIEDMKVSRKQLRVTGRPRGLECLCQGQNAMAYYQNSAKPSTRLKIKTGDTFFWSREGMVELHFKNRLSNQLCIRREGDPVPVMGGAGSVKACDLVSPVKSTSRPKDEDTKSVTKLVKTESSENTSSVEKALAASAKDSLGLKSESDITKVGDKAVKVEEEGKEEEEKKKKTDKDSDPVADAIKEETKNGKVTSSSPAISAAAAAAADDAAETTKAADASLPAAADAATAASNAASPAVKEDTGLARVGTKSETEDLALAPLERTSSAQWAIDEPPAGTAHPRQRHGSLSPGSSSRMLLGGSPRIWNGMSPRQRRLSAQSGSGSAGAVGGMDHKDETVFSWNSAVRGERAPGEGSPRRSDDGSSMPGDILAASRSQSPVFGAGPPTSETVRTANECPFPNEPSKSVRKPPGGASIFDSDKHHPHVMSPRVVAKRKRSTDSAADAAAAVAIGGHRDLSGEASADADPADGKRRRRSSRSRKGDDGDAMEEDDDDDERADNIDNTKNDKNNDEADSALASKDRAAGHEVSRSGLPGEGSERGGRASRRNSIGSSAADSTSAALKDDLAALKELDANAGMPPGAIKDGGTILPQGPGARVGNDFQVEIPAMLRKVKDPLLVGKGKGSIGAWNKLMHNEPEPLPIDADDRADTTLDWTPAERRAFNKGMYESLKDFISIYRNDPIFRNNGKSPHDLIAYYYKQYKDMPEYARWKAFVTEGTNAGLPPEYNAADEDGHGGDMSPRGTDLAENGAGARPSNLDTGVGTGILAGSSSGATTPLRTPKNVPGILLDMIKLGFLEPGEGVLLVEYQNNLTQATLNPDGTILCDGIVFDSVSSFSVHCKRKTNPKLSGDNGWLSIVFRGKTLDSIRARYQEKKQALELAEQGAAGAPAGKPIIAGDAAPSGRASRRSSVTTGAVASTSSGANLQRTNSMCSTSLPANFGSSTRSSVANLGVAGQGPATTTAPWSSAEPGSRRGGGRISTRQQATRQQGFFELQIESDSELEDEDASRLPPGVKLANAGPLPAVRSSKKDETMKNLIDAEVLRPGKRVLRVRYKGREFWADLRTDGIIVDCVTDGEYASPSLWSIEIKRRVNPNVRSDSGWYSIFYIPPGSAAAITETGSGNGSGAGGDDDRDSGEAGRGNKDDQDQNNMDDDDDDDDDMRSGIDEDNEETSFENLHVYRKLYRSVRESRRQQKMKESYSLLSEIRALRAKKQPPPALTAREDELASHQYLEAPHLQWRPQATSAATEDAVGEGDTALEEDETQSVSSRAGPGRKKRKRRKLAGRAALNTPRQTNDSKMYCMCQRRNGDDDASAAASESEGYDSEMEGEGRWYLQCSKATGACNGWIHPRCFDFDISQRDGERMREFICPLCSGDGVELRLVKSERVIKDRVAVYTAGTIVMSRLEYPAGNPVGWFPAKISEVDFTHHADTPYRIIYAFNPLLTEWISLGPNDPTRMLAVDWAKSDCYRVQDERWRESAANVLRIFDKSHLAKVSAGRMDRTDPDMCSDVIPWSMDGFAL
ncbi:MPN domain-containing protein [Hondaea fermentalgiana]|uniref:MPN domain-containing protein n=1 Tax=Hondaea fermentalgiana TaxID=2315210 RepID=A0A2R5GP24_9STRA|nr:MPN domain-containing protein [Hondaea fermentalgiana]|eukprot:GBG32630.1 MPN domain-containing protein [Hondaea fermentalgiana]